MLIFVEGGKLENSENSSQLTAQETEPMNKKSIFSCAHFVGLVSDVMLFFLDLLRLQ